MRLLLLLTLTGCLSAVPPEPTFSGKPAVRTLPARVALIGPVNEARIDALHRAMDQFPCKLFVHVQERPTVLLDSDDRFEQLDITGVYLYYYKQLGLALGLAEDPWVRPVRDYGIYEPDTVGRAHVSIMVKNLGQHINRLEWGYLLPELTPNDRKAVADRFCSGLPRRER